MGWGFSGVPKPSSVVISFPATDCTAVTQEETDSLAIDGYRAGATLRETTTELWAAQLEIVAEGVKQRRAWVKDLRYAGLTIH